MFAFSTVGPGQSPGDQAAGSGQPEVQLRFHCGWRRQCRKATTARLFQIFVSLLQGWEFALVISERIARFLSKNEPMSDSLKKMRDSLIRLFLVSDLSDSLTIAHFF